MIPSDAWNQIVERTRKKEGFKVEDVCMSKTDKFRSSEYLWNAMCCHKEDETMARRRVRLKRRCDQNRRKLEVDPTDRLWKLLVRRWPNRIFCGRRQLQDS
jgi:hypothetical protein